MKISVIKTFINRQAKDDEDPEVQAGRVLDVSDARGQELIDLGLAQKVKATPAPKTTAGQ